VLATIGVCATFSATAVTAAVPTLDSVYPPGGEKGTEIALTLNGKFDPWPCSLWFSRKGLTFTPDPDPKKIGTGKLRIAPDAAPGPVFIRAQNAEGATAPVFFIISDQNEILEEEKDNSTVAGAAPLDRTKLPLVLNGTLSAGGELDSKRITLEKGETLFAAVEAYALRSLVDPAIHLHDSAGNRLLLEHDGPDNLDPLLSFTAPEKGDYILSLAGFSHPPAASVAYTGSKSANYRLHLALKREQLPKHLGPSDPGPDTAGDIFTPGKPAVGTLKATGEPARYKITAKKGDKFLVKVEGRALGFPIDPVLRILKADGSEIRKEDDTNKSADPEYLWTVAEDAEYGITVSDRFSRSGNTMRYRLSAAPPVAGFTVTLDKNLYAMERGKPLEIKATVVRLHDHKDNLAFTIPGLPGGITLTAPETVPEKGGEVILKLEAKPDAPAASLSLRVIATEKKAEGDTAKSVEKTAVFSFKDDNHRGPYVLDEIEDIWLTLPPVKEEKKEEKKEVEKPK
jgi:hypothetical protein